MWLMSTGWHCSIGSAIYWMATLTHRPYGTSRMLLGGIMPLPTFGDVMSCAHLVDHQMTSPHATDLPSPNLPILRLSCQLLPSIGQNYVVVGWCQITWPSIGWRCVAVGCYLLKRRERNY